ncbi:MAG TPA: hemolysin family protein [Acidimicrobiales bacterium]|nr:hemolysin family protein [Acidimicrobiales bacterium]
MSAMSAVSRFRPTDWILIAVVLLLLVVSAGLALAETSLVRMSRTKAMALQDDGRRGAGSLMRLVQDPEGFLNPVLLLVLISQLVTATLVGILAERWFGAVGVMAATVFEVVVIFVLAEALPKNWAVQNPERSALLLAPIVSAVVRFPPIRLLSRGLIALANMLLGPRARRVGVSESELLAMADVALEEDVIEGPERELIHSIIEFGDTVVREVMVPRPDMRTLDGDQSVSEALGVAIEAGLSRLPVHAGNVDDIVGVANAKDLIRAEREGHGDEPIRDFVRRAHFVPETKRVARLMREMQDLKYHLAVVVDEYGGTAGVVTLEDLIEELVGEIVDEYDVEEPPVQALDNGGFSVSARLAVDELSELVDAQLPSGEWDTVGGLLFNELGRVPVEGESVEVDGLTLVAERVEGNRVGRIRIIPLPTTHPAGAEDHQTAERRE